MPQTRDELFWLAVGMVALALVLAAANHLLRPKPARPPRWLPVLAGLALMAPVGCAHHPAAPPVVPAQWDNGAWGDGAYRQTRTPPGGSGPSRTIPMNDPNTFGAIAAAFIRHALTLAGGFLVAKGVIGDAQSTEFVGIGMAGFAFAWSWLQKHNAAKRLADLLPGRF